MRTRWKVLASIVSLSLMGLAAVAPTPATATPDRPTRVLIIILDQMRPDYVQRFDMRNVKALMRGGVNFPRARLGHMAAETVISHNVITSGQFPKHMGWTNEVYRDVAGTLGGGDGAYYVSSSLSCDQFGELITAQGYPKLEDYLGTGGSDGKFVSIGNKTTSSCPAGQPALDGVDNDIIIRLGSSATLDCDGDGTSESWRPPSGVNVPAYVSASCGRFYVNVSNPFGTDTTAPAWMYPADGARYIRGNDPKHLGGDVWAADAAIKVMRNDGDWDGMLVSMPAIDKTAHMWGTDDTGPSGVGDDIYDFAHLPRSAKIADRQVGKILRELEAQGIDDETLVVLTTDHAGQTANRFHGIDGAGREQLQLVLRPGCGRDLPGPEPRDRGPRRGARRQPRLLLPGRAHRGVVARHGRREDAGGGAGTGRPSRRDRDVLAHRRPLCRAHARSERHDARRARLVPQQRATAGQHDGGGRRQRPGRRRRCSATTRRTA